MVVRELKNGSSLVSLQEDHAELAAQFAAHWGNHRFSKLRPYKTMVFATTYHDSGYREWEGNPPMNVAKGRPYAHREEIPSFESVELRAYARNVEWLSSQDRYAGLLVPCTAPVSGKIVTKLSRVLRADCASAAQRLKP